MVIRPALISAATGFLALAACGVAQASAFRVAYSFRGLADGQAPSAGLTAGPDGAVYGMAQGRRQPDEGGTVFRFDPAREALTVLHRFTPAEGRTPSGRLAYGPDGTLYGTLADGGAGGCGAVFALSPGSHAYRTLASFDCGAMGGHPASGVVIAADGALYGTTSSGGQTPGAGTIFRLDPAASALSLLPHAGATVGALLPLHGALFGAECVPGAAGGRIFRLELTGASRVLHNFPGACAAPPLAADAGGKLYAALRDATGGALVSLDPGTGAMRKLAGFPATARPSGLATGADGAIYGIAGMVFRYDPAQGAEAGLHGFGSLRAARAFALAPPNPQLLADGVAVYGTTRAGGADGRGSLFELLP